MQQIEQAKNRLKNKEFMNRFLLKENADEKRRIYTRYIPSMIVICSIVLLIGWLLKFFWFGFIYLAGGLSVIVIVFFLYLIIPSFIGPLKLYYGTDKKFPQKLGFIIPVKDSKFYTAIPEKNNNFTSYLIENIDSGKFDVKFIFTFPPDLETEIIEKETNTLLELIGKTPTIDYKSLRQEVNERKFNGKIQFVISSITGYVPDSSGLDFYRSNIHPERDNISVYHLENLKDKQLVLGYTNEDLIFIPYYKDMWFDL